jgi:hypothetical protein
MRRWRPGAVDADPELIVLTVLAVLLYVGAAQGWPLSPVRPPYGTRWPACAGPGCWSAWVRWRLHWPAACWPGAASPARVSAADR